MNFGKVLLGGSGELAGLFPDNRITIMFNETGRE
jgi:hypothetical protein